MGSCKKLLLNVLISFSKCRTQEASMKVVLTEKPSVARDIAAVLGANQKRDGYFEGNGYKVTYAFGHLVTIAEPEKMKPTWGGPWRMEQLPMIPSEWKYRIADKAEQQFACIRNLFLNPTTTEIICATDAGREGQHIFDLIYQLTGSSKPVQRLWISSLTPEARISISRESWREAAKRLAKAERLPAYMSFILAAGYFSRGDPLRAIIMACAAWETALRYYLANVAPKADPTFARASRSKNIDIPRLYQAASRAKGSKLFQSNSDPADAEYLKRHKKLIHKLPEWRNRLLHQGSITLPDGAAEGVAVAVLNAIEWLFE